MVSFTFRILIPFTLALKGNLVQEYLNSVFPTNTYFVKLVILSITSCYCAWETVIRFNFIIEHPHLALGQRGANLLLRIFVPRKSFSWVATVRIILHIKCQRLELCDQQPEHMLPLTNERTLVSVWKRVERKLALSEGKRCQKFFDTDLKW